MTDTSRHRTIRSFVRREGRLTAGQQRALNELWPHFGIDIEAKKLDLATIFGRSVPIVLEIGFGNGASLATMAAAAPEKDFIGIEVHRPGVGHLLQLIEEQALSNLRVISDDAVEVLKKTIPDASLDTLLLLFPDPWHKKRHHKRRIVQPGFISLLAQKIKPGGTLHMATDWQNYAEHMLAVMKASPDFRNLSADGGYLPRPDYRPLTKFEQRGQRLGHEVYDLIYRRN